MMLPVLFLLLCATLTKSLDEGESCSLKNASPGVCTLATKCESVIEKLTLPGNEPDVKICGYSSDEEQVLVCCPKSTSVTTRTLIPLIGDGRGAIASQKCAEFAQSVYVLKNISTLAGDHKQVNLSQCASTPSLIENRPKLGEFPHMAAIGFDSTDGGIGWYCGGTLISETFVLTAAHCTNSREGGDATWVRVGGINLVQSEEGAKPEDRRVVELIRHPEYKLPSWYHDIALLRLESPVPFNAWIRPACLDTAPSTRDTYFIATGWDHGDDAGSDQLRKVRLSEVHPKICNTSLLSDRVNTAWPKGVVDDWLICANTLEILDCQGESGGPLVVYSDRKYHCMYDVVGVTSFRKLCGVTSPGVYTRVYNYIPWIEFTVWGRG